MVIDEDRDSAKNGIVYYWEVNWPRFFSNRDYCCYRENSVEERTGTMVVVSHSVEHPACPSKKKTWRVEDYHSVLAIRPHTTRYGLPPLTSLNNRPLLTATSPA